jgi:hypothetical protein
MGYVGNGNIRRLPEYVHAKHKQHGVDDARNNYPFPQTMRADESVRSHI